MGDDLRTLRRKLSKEISEANRRLETLQRSLYGSSRAEFIHGQIAETRLFIHRLKNILKGISEC